MNKIFIVKKDFVNSRIDRWIKRNIRQVPQSLIEKSLRNKNVTINKLKVKSSYKLKIDDKIYFNNMGVLIYGRNQVHASNLFSNHIRQLDRMLHSRP